jgi:leucyl-tRNA synthetase
MHMKGHSVFEPMGFDSFGIHTENHALQTGRHPAGVTDENIHNFRHNQLSRLGCMFDWNHSVITSNPDYYRWTQWLFVKMVENGLASRRKAPVNWCPECCTVLADSQIEDGLCERHPDTRVEQKRLLQWFFHISKYADRLWRNLDHIKWDAQVIEAQRQRLDRKEGAYVNFRADCGETLEVFTTRPETLFGVTFLVLAPEHPLVERMTSPKQVDVVEAYRDKARMRNRFERSQLSSTIDGVALGSSVRHPVTGKEIPLYIADYVLEDYATGMVMGVPAHDSRDYEFAVKEGIDIVRVIASDTDELPYTDDGQMVDSGPFTGMDSSEARTEIPSWLDEKEIGRPAVVFGLRDWCISRQRYWGPPIPVVHCEDCGCVPVPEKDLPVLLPRSSDYIPDGTARSPLARNSEWTRTTCPRCGISARRETNVSDNFLDSAWYYLRYPSIGHTNRIFDAEINSKWLPIDLYIGGREHARGHLLYIRFITMVLHDLGMLQFEEPCRRFVAHGTITRDGRKMGKSKGNVINPEDYLDPYGTDAFRLMMHDFGPFEQGGEFKPGSIKVARKLVERLWNLCWNGANNRVTERAERLVHQTVKSVTRDIEQFKYHTAIAQFRKCTRILKEEDARHPDLLKRVILLMAPFAPFVAEECWTAITNDDSSVFGHPWPDYDEDKAREPSLQIAIQINGKTRAVIEVAPGILDDELVKTALAHPNIQRRLSSAKPDVRIVPGRVVNFTE